MIDGVDHINIYSKGKTMLGRKLSNFCYMPFICEDGWFASIEAYWFWLGTHNEDLRPMYGFQAKKFGGSLPKTVEDELFQNKIKKAMRIKAQILKNDLLASDLPFKHYYMYGDKVVDAGFEWIVDEWESIRDRLKQEVKA